MCGSSSSLQAHTGSVQGDINFFSLIFSLSINCHRILLCFLILLFSVLIFIDNGGRLSFCCSYIYLFTLSSSLSLFHLNRTKSALAALVSILLKEKDGRVNVRYAR